MLFMVTNRQIVGGKYGNDGMPGHKYECQYEHINGQRREDGFARKDKNGFKIALLTELERLRDSGNSVPKVGLYLPGYNNDYQDGIDEIFDLEKHLTTVLGHPPIIVGFSWPSSGKVRHYRSDKDEVRDSVGAFSRFIKELNGFVGKHEKDCFSSTFCIAHSMGAYLLRKGLGYLSGNLGDPKCRALFDETILLAPDLDADSLGKNKKGRYIGHFSRRVHVYYSKHDWALKWARKKLRSRRLGRHGAENYDNLEENIVVVDAKKYANEESIEGIKDRWNSQVNVHSSHRYHPEILADVVQVMRSIDRDLIPNRQLVQREDTTLHNHYELV